MIRFKVNHKEVEVAAGAYLLPALQALGYDIPHLCYYEGLEHYTSCMLCLVKDARTGVETSHVENVLAGEIDPFIEAYLKWHHAKKTQAAKAAE